MHLTRRKGGKKTIANSSGGGRRSSPQENQVVAQPPTKGSKSQPDGQGSQRHHTSSPTGCQPPVVELGPDTCPSWTTVRGYDPNLCNCDIKTSKPTENVGEEWWEILFEDIGILPVLQPARTLRTIHMHWRNFRETHPVATRYTKWVSWHSGIAVLNRICRVPPTRALQNIP